MALLLGCIGTDVVDIELVDEKLTISTRLSSLAVGDTYQFMAGYFNNLGEEEMATISWTSSDENIISISDDGFAEAHMAGEVTISAMYMGVEDVIEVRASDETSEVNTRSGSFMGTNRYTVGGDFNMIEEGGELILTFEENFQASAGPGLFIYLSNSATTTTGALEVGSIKTNRGKQVYEISLDQAGLFTYDYVLVWCKPFGVLFGLGEFDN